MSEEEFRKIYNQVVNENVINQIEIAKIEMKDNGKYKTKFAIIIVILPIIILIIMGICGAMKVNKTLFVTIVAIMVLISGWYIWKIYSKIEWKDTYGDILKNYVVKPLERIIYEGYTYIPENGIPEETFKNLKLYKFNEYATSKLLCGSLKHNCKFKMANVSVASADYDMSGHYYCDTKFSGICIEIEMSNTLKNNLYLKDRKRSFTKTAKKLNLYKSKVLIGNNQFDKMYEIYTDDIELVNKILKENIIQKLLEYYEIKKQQCEIVIQEKKIYIMFPSTYMFDIILYDREKTYKETLEKYRRLNFAVELANTIIDEIYS